ncbi:hypothetical protein U2100_15325, partial [Listeria monocytogenes]|uniref:hypothetical protein n=1 Tax=Listeria monocytogenes TaxID=1639 RepID=UPI002FDBCA6C
ELESLQFEQTMTQRKEVVAKYVPDIDTKISDIAELMKEDGATTEIVEAFKAKPFQLDPVALFNLSKRAELSKSLSTVKQELEAAKT